VVGSRVFLEGEATGRDARIAKTQEAQRKYQDRMSSNPLELLELFMEQHYAKQAAEELPAKEAEAAGAGKDWYTKLTESLSTSAKRSINPLTAPLMPVDTISTGLFGYDIPALTSAQEAIETIQEGVSAITEARADEDVKKASNILDLGARAMVGSRGFGAFLSVGEAAGFVDDEAGAALRAISNPSENMKALSDARYRAQQDKRSPEEIEAILFESMSTMAPSDFPYTVGAVAPNVDEMLAHFEQHPEDSNKPQFDRLMVAIEDGKEDKANAILRSLPYGAFPEDLQKKYMPSPDYVG
jgi:hypothetical protein